MQCAESQQKVLGMSRSSGGVSQRLKCVGIPNVGPKKRYVSQNNMGIRERKEGDTQVLERVSKKGHFGLQTGRNAAQNPSPRQETYVGQSPKRHREQAEWSIVKNAVDNQRVKSTGLSVEKTKITEKYSLVSLQKSEDIAGEEKEHQEKCSTHMSGQKKEKNKQRGWGTEEGRSLKEVKGSQTGENGRSIMISDRESISGKVPRDTLSFAIAGVDGVEDRFNVGEKSKSTTSAEDGCLDGGNDRGVNTHVGREFKPKSCHPNIPGETSMRLGLEVEEDIGARAGRSEGTGAVSPGKSVRSRLASSGRVRMYLSMTQEQKDLGADQAHGAVSGSGSTSGPGLEMGRIQGRLTGLDLDWASQSPSYSNRPTPDGANASSHKCSKAKDVGEESRLKQGPVLRPSMPLECKRASSRDSNFGEEGNNTHCREEDVIREDLPQDDVCFYTNRYVDNLNDLSPSSRFSVFGRPLLSGGFSGLGGTTGYEDMELMRMAVDDGRGRGWDYAGVTTVFREGSEAVGRRIEESHQEPSESAPHDSWENSCLAKFSEFLGFPTKGFEKEILDLLRNLVAQQKSGKEKGAVIRD